MDDERKATASKSAQIEYGGWLPKGFQERKIRRPRKKLPAWAKDEAKLLARCFRGSELRRFQIGHLYWGCGWNSREVAEELSTTIKSVESIIYRLKRSKPRV